MSKDFYNNITIQMAGDDQSPLFDDLIEKTSFIQSASSLNLADIIAPAENHMDTSKLGHLWGDVAPQDGKYTFEIATVLPYYLPDFEKCPEYSVTIDEAEIFVSSRMVKCFYTKDASSPSPLQYYLVHRLALGDLISKQGLLYTHPVPLRSFVTKRYYMEGTSAEEIIQNNFYSWVRHFVNDLSCLLDSVRTASPKDTKQLLPQMATTLLPMFWISVKGANEKVAVAQFAADLPTAAFRSLSNLDKSGVKRARSFLAGSNAIPIHDSALGLATTYAYYGYLGLALVQVCIACESVLAQAYEKFLTSRGVSKTKYAEAERDITFSQLLNLHLAAIKDLSKLEGHEKILSQLNYARRCRNDVVHKGSLQQVVTANEVDNAIDAANKLKQVLLEVT